MKISADTNMMKILEQLTARQIIYHKKVIISVNNSHVSTSKTMPGVDGIQQEAYIQKNSNLIQFSYFHMVYR